MPFLLAFLFGWSSVAVAEDAAPIEDLAGDVNDAAAGWYWRLVATFVLMAGCLAGLAYVMSKAGVLDALGRFYSSVVGALGGAVGSVAKVIPFV